MTSLPSLDVTEATGQLEAIGKAGAVTADNVVGLETTLKALEAKAVVEAARLATEKTKAVTEKLTQQEAARVAKEADRAAKAAARAQKQAADAALKLQPESSSAAVSPTPGLVLPAAAMGAAAEPVEVVATPVADTLETDLEVALNPKLDAGAIKLGGVVNFQQLAEGLKERAIGAMSEESKAKLRAFDFSGWLKGVLALKTNKDNREGLFFDEKGNNSRTRTGVAWLMPDGKVILAGLLKEKALMRVGAGTKTATLAGPAIQRMSDRPRGETRSKAINPGGLDPVLFADLVKSGAIPIDAIAFDMAPGQIYQEFTNRDAYENAIKGTELAPKSVRTDQPGAPAPVEGETRDAITSAEQAGATQAAQTAAPEVPVQQRLADVFGEAPDQLAKILKRAKEHGPAAAFAKLPSVGREQIEALLTEANATQADLTEYLESQAPAAPAVAAPAPVAALPAATVTPAAPVTAEPAASTSFQEFASKLARKPKFAERLFKLIDTVGQGNFEKAFKKMPEEARDAITDIVLKGGLDWKEFSTRIQKAFDTSAGTSTSFVAGITGAKLRESSQAVSVDRTTQFNTLLGRLQRNGFNVALLPGKGGGLVVDGSIVLTMQDMANANLENLVSLIHEVGHVEVDKLAPGLRGALSRAVDRTIAEVKDGPVVLAAMNANLNWEEKLVESLALRLGEEGISDKSIAATVWRAVKDAYLRMGMAMMKAFGLEPSDAHVLAWFENNMRRQLGGDYDFRFIDLFRPFVETKAQRVNRFEIIDGQEIPDLLNPLTGRVQRAEVLPDTVDAAMWNLDRTGDVRFRVPAAKPEEDMPYTEAMARVQAAGWAALMPTITKLKAELGPAMTEQQFWKVFSNGDLPADIVKKLEERVPGAMAARIGGTKMTEPMNERARYQAFRRANALAYINRKRAAANEEQLAAHTDTLVERAKAVNKVERVSADATEMNIVFNEELKGLVKELSRDLDRGPDTAHAAGKLLGAVRTIERLTGDEAIPEEYQRVFKRLLDGGDTSIFEHMSAISRLELPFGTMSVPAIVEAIQKNGASDPRLKSLGEQRPLMVALAALARDSARSMDLLQLNAMTDAAEYVAIKAELEEIRTASEARLDEIAKGITAVAESRSLRDRLREQYVKARRDFNSSKRNIQRAQENQLLRTKFATAMADKATELSRDVGAFSNWEASNKAEYHAMQRNDAGVWRSVTRTLRMTGEDVTDQHEQVAHDLNMNRLWLEAHQPEAGSRHYEEVRRQTDELSKLDFSRSREAVHRYWFTNYLLPLGQRFASTGQIAGTKIQQMLNGWQTVMFVHGDEVEAQSRRWNKALQEATEAAGYTNPKRFFQEVVNDVLYRVESEPGRDRTGAMREARRAAQRRLELAGTEVADNFSERLEHLLEEHKRMSELLLATAEKNGLYVADPRIRDPLTAKGNLQRHAIKYGYLTGSRRLNGEVVRCLVNDMQGNGWTDTLFSGLDPTTTKFEELVPKYFTPSVIRTFVEPFVTKPGKEVFFGTSEQPVSQVDAQLAWQDAGGDVLKFIDLLFDRTNQAKDRSQLPTYRAAMLDRFGQLYRMESKLAAKTEQTRSATQPDTKSHAMMDARHNDLIPPEHFHYEMYSPMDARRKLTEIAYHAAFGRDGKGLDGAFADLRAGLRSASDLYKRLPAGTRKEKRAFAEAQGWDFTQIERAAAAAQNVVTWERKLRTHFSGKEGVIGDARAALELAQLNMSLVLNQPKSGLWNLMTAFEYPLVYRGLGKTAVRASATAARVFAREVASSMLNVFGANFLRAADYAHDVGEVVERKQTANLPFGVLMSDIGPDGRFAEGGIGNRVTQFSRGVQTAMRKNVRGNNALWAPFQFISAKLDTAIATANVQAFEMMVKRGLDYFEQHPDARANPAFRFTAADLGMKGGGWFSDEGAFDFFRDRSVDYRLGNFEQIVRDARGREGKLLTRDQALGASMMAMNEVSLASSVNTRPVEFLDNTLARIGGLMLGWPLAKINLINQAFRDSDGRLSLPSAMRAVGIMAAWSLPAGLAYSLLMDKYDEKMLGKKSNLRGIDPIALTPVIGPALAVAAGDRGAGNIYGMLERLARAGTYGLGGDVINSFVNVVDPASGQRDFDLNSRVLIYSQYANVRDVFVNLLHQEGAYTYQSIGRPLLSAIGGGGVLQATQIVNNALELNNAEAQVTNRINVNNWLRAAGREAGLELRAGGGRSSPTPLSVWAQEMKTCALANDRLGFLEAYRHAVDVAREDGEADPEKKVLQSFKSRSPMDSVFAHKPSELELSRLYGALDETGQKVVRDAVILYDNFAEMLEPSPIVKRIQAQQKAQLRAAQPMTIEQMRRRAAAGALSY